jgi:hypothetical protein
VASHIVGTSGFPYRPPKKGPIDENSRLAFVGIAVLKPDKSGWVISLRGTRK